MELSDSFTVESPTSKVWELLWDFPRLAACMPGCDQIEPVDETNFKAVVKQRVGPFSVEMAVTFTIIEVTDGKSFVVTGGGSDRRGNTLKINRASLEVEALSSETTQVSYNADVTLFGKLGTLGYPIIKRKARDIGAEFTRRIVSALE